MHPLLARKRSLVIYFLAWLPLSLFLAYLLRSAGHLTWSEAGSLALPLCLLYQFMCLSAWYSCKSAPLDNTNPLRLAITHGSAAAIITLLWIEIGRAFSYGLSRSTLFSGFDSRYRDAFPVLFAAGFLLYLLAVAYHYVVLSLQASREAETRVMATTVLARDAELKALKAQVNPHFLFNSLNSISALTTIDPLKAREMCILLAEFLRMTLGLGEKSSIPLGEELELLERFLAIEKVRFGQRLDMREDIQEQAKYALIPPLLLQPLVENAVAHGIANLLEGGSISLSARSTESRVTIVLENTCDLDAVSSRRGGRGLANVRSRLEARYGKQADMRVSADAGHFRVQISLPLETPTPAPSLATENLTEQSAR
jgi:two-component system sensor histidine kinase AlgZ